LWIDLNTPKNISVLFVDHVSVIGGAERSLIDLSKGFSRQGIKCTFIVPDKGELYSALNDIGTVYCIPIHSWRWWGNSPFKLLMSLPLQIVALIRFYRLIKKINPDLVHLNINRLIEPLFAVRLLGIKSVMHYRDIPSRIHKRFFGGSAFFYSIMNLADVWIANSRATYNDIKPQARRPVFHVPNGIDVAWFLKAKEEHLPVNLYAGRRVLMIASLTPWKNLEGFIDLINIISKRMGNVHFYIAGSGNADYRHQLEKKVTSLQLNDRLTFLNKVEFIPALLQRIDVLVHTTIDEPFGNNGTTGFLVKPNAVAEMAEKLIRLLENRNLRLQLGEAGFKKAVDSFSLDQHRSRVLDVYKTLI
jgi:glycosyltransferase involved in cell wall biosynthesis